MDIIALVEFAFEVWDADHNSKVSPYIDVSQLQGLAHQGRRSKMRPRRLSSFDAENSFALESIEVFCKASSKGVQVVVFYGQGEQRIELIEGVQSSEKVSWVSMCRKREQISECWGKESRELGFGYELEERGFRVVYRTLKRWKKFHCSAPLWSPAAIWMSWVSRIHSLHHSHIHGKETDRILRVLNSVLRV